MQHTTTVLWTLVVLVCSGVALRRIAGADGATVSRGLGAFVFRLGLPAVLVQRLSTMQMTDIGAFASVGAAYAGSLAAAAAVALALAWRAERTRGLRLLLAVTAAAPNAGYLGLPLGVALVGDQAIPLISALILFDSLVTVTLMTIALSSTFAPTGPHGETGHGDHVWAALAQVPRSPLIQASLLGILLRIFDVTLPSAIEAPLAALAGATIPIALVALGAALPVALGGLRWQGAWPAVVAKLLVQPTVCFVVAGLAGLLRVPAMQAALVVAAAPIGLNVLFVAQGLRVEEDLAASLILISTVGCIVTVPLVVVAINLATAMPV